jgi:hypothetical protein
MIVISESIRMWEFGIGHILRHHSNVSLERLSKIVSMSYKCSRAGSGGRNADLSLTSQLFYLPICNYSCCPTINHTLVSTAKQSQISPVIAHTTSICPLCVLISVSRGRVQLTSTKSVDFNCKPFNAGRWQLQNTSVYYLSSTYDTDLK